MSLSETLLSPIPNVTAAGTGGGRVPEAITNLLQKIGEIVRQQGIVQGQIDEFRKTADSSKNEQEKQKYQESGNYLQQVVLPKLDAMAEEMKQKVDKIIGDITSWTKEGTEVDLANQKNVQTLATLGINLSGREIIKLINPNLAANFLWHSA